MKVFLMAVGAFAVVGVLEGLYFVISEKFSHDAKNLHDWEIDK